MMISLVFSNSDTLISKLREVRRRLKFSLIELMALMVLLSARSNLRSLLLALILLKSSRIIFLSLRILFSKQVFPNRSSKLILNRKN